MHPGEIHTLEDLSRALDVARRRAARGSGRGRISLTDLAQRTGIPRSTVHVYLSGRTLPPADALDAVLQALDVPVAELGTWADALDRVATPVPPDTAPVLTPVRDTGPVPRQLPLARRGLVGRDRELRQLDALLADHGDDPAPAVVALTGFGGVGKTTLVAAWAARHLDRFPDGQLWIDLHGFGLQDAVTHSAALGRLLRGCGVDTSRLPSDVESRAELLRSTVAGRRMLLVLDNAADSAHVRPLLAGDARSAVVVTSRSDLRSFVAETGAARVRLAPLDPVAGRALLRGDGAADLPDRLVDRLVRHGAGLPLALRILAERIADRDVATVELITDELDDRHRRLQALELDDGHDSLGIRTVLQSSHAALTTELARVFRVLPLCLGRTVTVENVAACLDLDVTAARRRLDGLVAASLIRDVGRDGYAVDDLVATFAEEVRADGDPGADLAADRRLATHLLDRLRAAATATAPTWDLHSPLFPRGYGTTDGFGSAEDARAWTRLAADVAVALATRAVRRGDPDTGWELAGRLTQVLGFHTTVDGLGDVLEQVGGAFETADRHREAANCWRVLGGVHSHHDTDLAGAAYGRSGSCAAAAGDDLLADIAARNLASVDLSRGWPERALPALLGVERRFAARGDAMPAAVAALITTACILTGDLDEATDRAHHAQALAVEQGDTWSAAGAASDLALIAEERGDPPEVVLGLLAHRRWEAPDDGHVDDPEAACAVRALVELGRVDEAAHVIRSARTGRHRLAGFFDLRLARAEAVVRRASGDTAGARDLLVQAVRHAERWSLGWDTVLAAIDLAELHLAVGDHAAATVWSGRARSLAEERGFRSRARRAAAVQDRASRAGPAAEPLHLTTVGGPARGQGA